MTTAIARSVPELPVLRVRVIEEGARDSQSSYLSCVIGDHLRFNAESLQSYFFARWNPVIYDALVAAAAIEYCDRVRHRPAFLWGREFDLSLPVHDPDLWNQVNVASTLHDALNFLTGDRWQIGFYKRSAPADRPVQGMFHLDVNDAAVIPYSDGMDSRAVAGLMARRLGNRLVRIRLGSAPLRPTEPFTAIPYSVRSGAARRFVESSARSRGFKFALIAGVAAYLAGAEHIIVPESGQGALGPALLPVGQAYGDFRSHPLFTGRMERFLAALLGVRVSFDFPQLWETKGETLATFVRECGPNAAWADTRSCWQQARQSSVEHKKRQCGICAACMLRRLSVQAAGLVDDPATYVWENLSATSFEAGASALFERRRITRAMREYAIAGTLHLDHLAALQHSSAHRAVFALGASQLSLACGLPLPEASERLRRLLSQHEHEWKSFVKGLGPSSFIADWATHAR